MGKPRSVVVDIDGPMSDFSIRSFLALRMMGIKVTYKEVLQHHHDRFIEDMTPKQREEFFCILDNPNFLRLDNPRPGSIKSLQRLRDYFNIVYVTARHNEEPYPMEPETLNWLAEWQYPHPQKDEDVFLFMRADRGIRIRDDKLSVIKKCTPYLNLIAGVGDEPLDAEIYQNCGFEAVMLSNRRFKKEHYPSGTVFFNTWPQIGKYLRDKFGDRNDFC